MTTKSEAKHDALELSAAQRRHIAYLVSHLHGAQSALDAAKKVVEAAQSNADNFILYCAEEAGITLGGDGWAFAQERMAFVHRGEGK